MGICREGKGMKIAGLQKLTLLDYPGKTACTVFFGGCNFRCPFCHNWELLDGSYPAQMDEEALISFLERRRGMLEGVCITGGEPLLSDDIIPLLKKIRGMGFSIKIDTNGSFPDRLQRIIDAGLADYIAMDIKNSPEKYAETAGGFSDAEKIRRSVEIIMHSGLDYEFRTTVVDELHCAGDFHGMGKLIRGAEKWFLQKFTDRDTVPFKGFRAPDADSVAAYADIMREYVKTVEIRG